MRPITFPISFLAALAWIVLVLCASSADADDTITLRGKKFDVFFIPGADTGKSPKPVVLYIPGDGGWRGFAQTMVKNIASWGYDAYVIDTRKYLVAFTGEKATLTPGDIMSDFRVLGGWIQGKSSVPVTIIGWSEGAGLGLAAAASDSNKTIFNGLITLGLSAKSELGWRNIDDLTWLTHRQPHEPTFDSSDYMARVSPLPLTMIQSSGDTDPTVDEARTLFDLALEPKQFQVVKASDHAFSGNTGGFFQVMKNSLQWITEHP